MKKSNYYIYIDRRTVMNRRRGGNCVRVYIINNEEIDIK